MGEAWSLVAATMQQTLFTLSGTPVTGATVTSAAVIVLLGVAASRVLRGALSSALRLRGVEQSSRWETLLRLTHYVVVGVAASMALVMPSYRDLD